MTTWKESVSSATRKLRRLRGLPIDRLVVPFVGDDLRRQVVWSSAQSPRLVRHTLRESEICYFQMAVAGEQEILWLQVTVYDLLGMQVL
jgi:hypothetical protein